MWDWDCDSISNAVEVHPPNAQYHFDINVYDNNPSRGNGFYYSGSLTGGLNLPDVNSAYYQYQPCATSSGCDPRWDRPDSNDWGILTLLNETEGTSRLWGDPLPPTDACSRYTCLFCQDKPGRASEFGVGDMSKYGGGNWTNSDGTQRHDWHQNGTEVDVRFLRTDHHRLPVDLHTSDSLYYDQLATIDLLNCFAATGRVDHILIDTVSAGIRTDGKGLILEDTTHFNHFHVRVVSVYIP